MYTTKQKNFLLRLARQSIANYQTHGQLLTLSDSPVDPLLKEIRAVFVTLTIDGQLRGCVGHLKAVQPLYQDVIENAARAAFNDSRFSPLEEKELQQINIEISVLTVPQKLSYSSRDDLLTKLHPPTDGVILKKGCYEATYLPQVWEELPSKEGFLSSLCQKAGLPPAEWEQGQLEVFVYKVEKL